MATTYQKIRQRKLIYLGLIIVLFFAAYVHRSRVIEVAAKECDLSETNLGKIDLGGSVSRFVLSSFRGPLVCGLWWEAIEQQKKHNFPQLELLITALTKLQPHYKGPWKYQAWNLAYNVSVEFDRAQDKFLYITKGIRWLMNGESQNRVNLWEPDKKRTKPIGDPEMRGEIAQTYSNKMYLSDEQLIFRPLLQMSCIPITQRDVDRLRNNPQVFQQFKKQYPRFIRRIGDLKNIADGDDLALDRAVLAFLEENRDVPSMWKLDATSQSYEPADDPFPRWPEFMKDKIATIGDEEVYQDGWDIARWWYTFACEPLPPPQTDLTEEPDLSDHKYYRRNKNKHSMIFRSDPARSQCHTGMALNKEGWIEKAQAAWEEGYQMWLQLARDCNIEHSTEEVQKKSNLANWYRENFRAQAESNQPPPKTLPPEEYKKAEESYKAGVFLRNLANLQGYGRYYHWRKTAEAARTDVYREASRSRYIAERRYTDWPVARAHYERTISLMSLLIRKPLTNQEEMGLRLTLLSPTISSMLAQVAPPLSNQLSDYGRDETTQQEDICEIQDSYLRVLARQRAPERLRAETMVWDIRQGLGMCAAAFSTTGDFVPPLMIPPVSVLNIDLIEDSFEAEKGPLDDYITPENRITFAQRDKTKKK